MAPLIGADGQIYAMAQGNLAVGGLGIDAAGRIDEQTRLWLAASAVVRVNVGTYTDFVER